MLNCQLSFKSESRSVVSYSLWPNGLQSPWNSASQNTGVGSLSLLQGIFPTQGLNPGLPHCRWILYQLSHKGSELIFLYISKWSPQVLLPSVIIKFIDQLLTIFPPCALHIHDSFILKLEFCASYSPSPISLLSPACVSLHLGAVLLY